MKKILISLTTIALILLLFSCEKKKDNPFIGSWENTETTNLGSVFTTMAFRADMTMTFTLVVTVNSQDITTATNYDYSYTETTITVREEGKSEETSEYIINDNYLVLSPGTNYERSYIKNN